MTDSKTSNQILNTESALSLLDGEKQLYKELLISFVKDLPFDTKKLQNLITEGAFTEGAKYIHLVKGAARQLGAERLSEAGQKLEDVLREKKEENINELCQKAITEYNLALAAIKDAINQI